MAAAPEREEEPVFELRVSLKIAGNEIDIAVLLRRNSELVEHAVRVALEVISGLFVGNITPGSIIVELFCTTRESFLTFMEDFEAKKVKQRLNEEFRKIGHNEELEVAIANDREIHKKLEQIRNTIQGTDVRTCVQVATSLSGYIYPDLSQRFVAIAVRNLAIPLCLPNNWRWDPQTGRCIKEGDRRSTLYLTKEALRQLRNIKDPVCVVSIAGEYGMGKSFVLSQAFNQPEVFPLGHDIVAETVGIWLWIVPEKYKDSHGREFTVVLLDSERIDSAAAEGFSDHQIFTLVVLLASVLIYNSPNVPKRDEVEGLDFIAKLSQRIQIRSKPRAGSGQQGEDELFHKIFPHFIWLLRDSISPPPSDCEDIKDYFLKKVLHKQDSSATSCNSQQVADTILRFFTGFDAFRLPSPTYDPETMKCLEEKKDEVNPKFWSDLKEFQRILKPLLAPKNSFNDGEFVTGEGLAALVELYTEAINTPGAIPNVQNAWNTFADGKFSEVKQAALETYVALLTSQLSDVLPCDNDTIRASHNAALKESLGQFMTEVNGFSTNKVELHARELKVSIEKKLKYWQTENEKRTRKLCKELFERLKKRHLDPVLQQLQGDAGAKLSFDDVIGGYKKIKDDYEKNAKGAKDVIASVFFDYHEELKKEEESNLTWLKKLKSYDEEKGRRLAAEAYQAKELKRLEEQMARLLQENQEQKNEMELLIKNLHEEEKRFTEQMEDERKNHQEELKNMMAANRKEAQEERKAFIAENNDLKNSIAEMQFKHNEQNMNMVKEMADVAARNEDEKRQIRQQLKGEADEILRAALEEVEDKHDKNMKQLRDDMDKNMKEMLNRASTTGYNVTGAIARDDSAKKLPEKITENTKETTRVKEPGFVESLIGGVVNAVGSVIGGITRRFTSVCPVQ